MDAGRMVRTLRAELGTEHGTVQRVATQLGAGTESVRSWVGTVASSVDIIAVQEIFRLAVAPSAQAAGLSD